TCGLPSPQTASPKAATSPPQAAFSQTLIHHSSAVEHGPGLAIEHSPPMPAVPASAHTRPDQVRNRSKSSWPAKQAGFRSAYGRYWARTSDPQLVELVLSQLS